MLGETPQEQHATADGTTGDVVRLAGVIKWFDVTRGFGFAVADDSAIGDVLVHFSVLQPHGRRSLPEGARVEALVVEQGLQYSLLGMSYLGRLSAFEATPSGLTLRP